jgi:transcription initiation factor TFIIIB Brf1 subunit/transcription initiation factor TFIIB
MSAPWGGPDNVCPKCGSADVNPPDEGSWPSCNDCGHVQYDEATLALQREVQREQQYARQILGYVPKYEDWLKIQRGEKLDDET